MRCLPSGPKVSVHVSLPQRLTQFVIGEADATLPARLNFLLAGEVLLELELGIDEGLRKPRSGGVQHVPTHVSLERVQRFGFQDAADLLEEVGIRHIELGEVGSADRGEIAIEIEVGPERDSLVAAHLVIAVLRIAALGAVHRVHRQHGLDHQNGLRRVGRLLRGLPGQRKQLGRVIHEMLPHRRFIGVFFDVVVAVGQRQAPLVDVGDNLVGIVQVGCGIEIKQRIRPDQVQVRDLVHQRALVLHGGDAVELRLQRCNAFCVRRLLIHAGTVEVADSLIDGIAASATGCRLLQNAVLDVEVAFAEFHETYPGRLIGRNLGVLDPVAAGVLIEIHAGIDGFVDGIEAETRSGPGGSGLGEAANSHEKQQGQKETGHAHMRLSPFRRNG